MQSCIIVDGVSYTPEQMVRLLRPKMGLENASVREVYDRAFIFSTGSRTGAMEPVVREDAEALKLTKYLAFAFRYLVLDRWNEILKFKEECERSYEAGIRPFYRYLHRKAKN